MIRISANVPVKKNMAIGQFGIAGANITSDALGFDEFGTPLGLNELGGIAHFKNRTQPVVNH